MQTVLVSTVQLKSPSFHKKFASILTTRLPRKNVKKDFYEWLTKPFVMLDKLLGKSFEYVIVNVAL